uniref:uncharacterized protein LOC122587568 n=1 Tax=Erigeron canadensis TaxID=72917 RepID=UPI001CB9C5A8|nr:uncharacterized protein LOC122587568 [Erigeron canadensis]
MQGVTNRRSVGMDRGQWRELFYQECQTIIQSWRSYDGRFIFKWAKAVMKKCNIFVWRAALDRLPTYKALSYRNFNFGNTHCGLCEAWEETIDHLLCYCQFALEVWGLISNWCKVENLSFSSVKELILAADNMGLGKKSTKVCKGIVFVMSWCLWKARNEKVFD